MDQNTGISEENIAKFIAYYSEVSLKWLITGHGSMFRDRKEDSLIKEPSICYGKSPPGCINCSEKDRIIRSLEDNIRTKDKLICLLEEKITLLAPTEQVKKGA